jgi:3-deoxy-7-phosphoheptulonate synthase
MESLRLGLSSFIGFMVESNLREGSQVIPGDLSDLVYGVSVTDECVGWEKTEELLRHAHESLER